MVCEIRVINKLEIERLNDLAVRSENKRERISLHASHDSKIQEMLICMVGKNHYIKPHKTSNEKSYIWLEGRLLVVIFDEDIISKICTLDQDNKVIRLDSEKFHTTIPLSENTKYLEIALGPYKGTTYADWNFEDEQYIKLQHQYE